MCKKKVIWNCFPLYAYVVVDQRRNRICVCDYVADCDRSVVAFLRLHALQLVRLESCTTHVTAEALESTLLPVCRDKYVWHKYHKL